MPTFIPDLTAAARSHHQQQQAQQPQPRKRRYARQQPTTEQVKHLDTSLHHITDRSVTTKTLPPLCVSPRQAADMLNIGYNQLYALLHAGEIPSFTIGRKSRRIAVTSLETFIRERLEERPW